jgi:hypothetical protein
MMSTRLWYGPHEPLEQDHFGGLERQIQHEVRFQELISREILALHT